MPERDYLQRLASQRFEGQLRNDFERAIDQLTEDFPFEEVVALIQQGEVETAVSRIGLDPKAFADFQKSTGEAFAAGARETQAFIPPQRGPGGDIRKAQIKVNLGEGGSPRAERAVDNLNTGVMRGLNGGPAITEEGKRSVQNHIRTGLAEGRNPRDVARDLRGRWDSKAGAYRGGILGLTDHQRQIVRRAEDQLRSGDKQELRKYLGRKLRDKRFDRTVINAINNDQPIPEDKIRKMSEAYNRKYVKFRSETVARDQSLKALTAGQEEAFDQAIDQGAVKEEQIRRDWVTSGDARVRNHHQAIPALNRGGRKRGVAFETPLNRTITVPDDEVQGPVWRHEYGHAMDDGFEVEDDAIPSNAAISLEAHKAIKRDAKPLNNLSKKGNKSTRIGANDRETVIPWMREHQAEDLSGIPLEDFGSKIDEFMGSSPISRVELDEVLPDSGSREIAAVKLRVAVALSEDHRDPEVAVWGIQQAARINGDAVTSKKATQLADTMGAATRNRVGWGHPDDYWKKGTKHANVTDMQSTEMMANYTALRGQESPAWMKLMEAFLPETKKEFDRIMKEIANGDRTRRFAGGGDAR